jgi:hypothetical protein
MLCFHNSLDVLNSAVNCLAAGIVLDWGLVEVRLEAIGELYISAV